MKNKYLIFLYAFSTLAGTIIGVGLFSLPYLTLQAGWKLMLFYLLTMGLVALFLHLFFGELARHTPDRKRLPGFAQMYLGSMAKRFVLVSHSVGLLGAILAYIIVGGAFLYSLIGPILGGTYTHYVLVYFLTGAILFLFGIKAIEKIQVLGLLSFIIILAALFWEGRQEIELANVLPIARGGGLNSWFLPYGVLLFSFWGVSLIPQIEEMLGRYKRFLPKVIGASIALPLVVYFFFVFVVLGISGDQTTPTALTGVTAFLSKRTEILLLGFGVVTTFTSFIALGLTLMQVLDFDLRLGRFKSWAVTCFVPFILYIFGVRDFIQVIAFIGAVMLAIDGIVILLMYRRGVPIISSWKKIVSRVLLAVLLGGIIFEVVGLIL